MADFLSFLLLACWRGVFLPRADVVMALTTPPLVSVLGAILSLLWRARFVCWLMDLNPDEAVAVGWLDRDGPVTDFLETALRWSLERAERVIVPDIYMRGRLLGKGVPAEKMEVIPLWVQGGVIFDAAGRERFRREHGLEGKYVVMYAGNHTPCHPLDTLMSAARLLRDEARIHFCFIGGGMDWGRWRDRARAEGWENATFLGYQPEAGLSGQLSAADVQVVVMGEAFVGIVHPCKVYNFLAAERPFISIGPERSHIADLIREAGLEAVSVSLAHGQSRALAEELRRRVCGKGFPAWPASARTESWEEESALRKMVSVLEGENRFD